MRFGPPAGQKASAVASSSSSSSTTTQQQQQNGATESSKLHARVSEAVSEARNPSYTPSASKSVAPLSVMEDSGSMQSLHPICPSSTSSVTPVLDHSNTFKEIIPCKTPSPELVSSESTTLVAPVPASLGPQITNTAGSTTGEKSVTVLNDRNPKKRHLPSKTSGRERKLILQQVRGDGNCLFRSVSIQVYGDESWHDRVREECVDFMAKDEAHFGGFVDGDFVQYISDKRKQGCYGDNPEIQSMAELYNRPVMVFTDEEDHAAARGHHPHPRVANTKGEEEDEDSECLIYVNSAPRKFKRMNIFHNKYCSEDSIPIRLCYRGRNHYDAVVDPNSATIGVGLGFANFEPGKADRDLLKTAAWTTDIEATEQEIERIALQASLEDVFGKQSKSLFSKGVSTSAHTKKKRKSISSAVSPRPAYVSAFPQGTMSNTATSSSSSSSSAVRHMDSSSPLATAHSITGGLSAENISPVIRELVLNGFSLENVLLAHAIVGDSFDDMLALLISSNI